MNMLRRAMLNGRCAYDGVQVQQLNSAGGTAARTAKEAGESVMLTAGLAWLLFCFFAKTAEIALCSCNTLGCWSACSWQACCVEGGMA